MAKTAKKKLNRKMRKSIRRTFASVFLITAIIVAAIPVPENYAVEEGGTETPGEEGGTTTTPSDPVLAYVAPAEDMEFTDIPDLDPDGKTLEDAQMIQKRSDGSWELDWQYKFYLTDINGAPKGVIAKYNNTFRSEKVDLPYNIVYEYKIVLSDEYDDFFDADNDKELKNVTEGGTVEGVASEDVDFFEKYFQDELKHFKDLYTEYYKNMKEWEKIPDNPNPEPEKPANVKIVPKDMNPTQKGTYYYDKNLASTYGQGYSMTAVTDKINTSGDPGDVANITSYIPQGGEPTGGYYNDSNGFLYEKAASIAAIGNGAFKDVENVVTLTIPEEIGYIGDEAFYKSFLQSITLINIRNIGNQAFKECSQLTTVEISNSTVNIGNEAFMNSGITSVLLPATVAKIGHGAFAFCHNLKTVDLSGIKRSKSEIEAYAFYDCTALDNVRVEEEGEVNKAIVALGDAAFAVESGVTGSMTEFRYPRGIADEANLGKQTLAGRTNLKYVTMPADYGKSKKASLSKDTFYNCINLEVLEFPDDGNGSCGLVTFENDIFSSIIKENFYVRGPELDLRSEIASPRKSTWVTSSEAAEHIPYVYQKDGVDYYEVSDGNYRLLVNEDGELSSCIMDPIPSSPVELVIPSQVGNFKVTSIAEGCFDENTKKYLGKIIIKDDSISQINDNVFEGCPKLKEVIIGDSVESIGTRAFANCPELETVYFNPPQDGDYAAFSIGTDAFATQSTDLTFYGDIVDNYAPFVWAVNPGNYMDSESGKRVCYKSFEYADIGTERFVADNLTVMYDTNAKDVVLLNYPKYSMLDEDNDAYIEAREKLFTKKYDGETHEGDGPWRADYFDDNPYSIIKHYEEGGSKEWETLTPYESDLVKNCLEIEVPSGVTSIDVKGFYGGKDNGINWNTYVEDKLSSAEKEMYKNSDAAQGIVAGLFSGNFADNKTRSEKVGEKEVKGNDYVEKIILNSVSRLPNYAFDSCESLQTVSLGDDLKDIGTSPFRGCSSLQNVVGNSTYIVENGIIYSDNGSGLTIEECFPTRGNGYVGEAYMNSASDPRIKDVTQIKESAFENCDYLVRADLTDMTKLTTVPKYAFKNCDKMTEVLLPKSIRSVLEEAFKDTAPLVVTVPAREVSIVTSAFEHDPSVKIVTFDDSAALSYAKYYGLSHGTIGEDIKVTFLDHDGTILGEIQFIEKGKDAQPPANPVRDGYTFTGWSGDYKNIQEDTTLIAQYKANDNGGGGTGGGNGGTGGGNNNNNNNNNNNSNKDDDDSESDNNSKSKYHTVIVIDGGGGGTYKRDATVTITANAPPTGKKFKRWETSSKNVSLADASDSTTTFKMPKNDVEIKAVFKGDPVSTSENSTKKENTTTTDTTNTNTNKPSTGTSSGGSGTSGTSSSGGSGSGSSTNNNNNNGSSAVVNSSGVSNKDKTSVTVDGSTDNFIVKISDSSDASGAVERALTKEFGSLDNIRYFPMDITLYDSTGASEIEDTEGLTVNITMPIPDQLVQYAGNNKAGAVVGDDNLEKLDAKLKTIDGVSCISFQATHFSPYTIYVDTANLTAAMDSSPQTGDGIHPKWFLAIGLASLSVILFMKKDKDAKVKIA